MLENGLIQTGAGFFVQRIILGLLIIAAVALQLQQRRSGPGSFVPMELRSTTDAKREEMP